MRNADYVRTWARRFAVLGDPSRLALLLTIQRDGPICVSDLAATTGLKPTTVSQALRLLRAHELVRAEREGSLMRYELVDDALDALLGHVLDPASAASVLDDVGPT